MKIIVQLLIFPLCMLAFSSFKGAAVENTLEQAFKSYQKAERSLEVQERKTEFNQALRLYVDLEQRYSPYRGNGKLYYNIGNCYFQLGEYPFAVFYYNRALDLMPRSEKVARNLKSAQKKLGINQPPSSFHYFSHPEKMQLFVTFFLLNLLTLSFSIWYPTNILKRVSTVLMIAASLTLLSIGYTHYVTPIEGIVVNGTMLYRDAGKEYAVVKEEPVLSGLKVKVLQVLSEGRWLKIETPQGEIGYVPFESVRNIGVAQFRGREYNL